MRKYHWLPVWKKCLSPMRRQEKGLSLLELLVWAVFGVLLIAPAASLLGWAVHMYDRCLAEMALEQDMRFALCSIESDVRAAHYLKIRQNGAEIELCLSDAAGAEEWVYYVVRDNRITKNTQPVTGDSHPYRTVVTKCMFEQISAQAVRVKLEACVQEKNVRFSRSVVLTSDFISAGEFAA